MHMVGHAADAEAFAIHVAGDRGVQRGPHGGIEHRSAVLGAKDDMRQEIGERLRHGAVRWVGPSALMRFPLECPGALPQAGIEMRRWRGRREREEEEELRLRFATPLDFEGQRPKAIPAWGNAPGISNATHSEG
jgi:hypothetical protein